MQLHAGTIRAELTERQSAAVQLLLIAGFAAGTAIGAQIELPHRPVPYTLQTFFVLLSGTILGKRNGAISQALYLAAGAAGLPVFAHWGAGFVHLAGPTGGYLLSFPIASFLVGAIAERSRGIPGLAGGMICGLLLMFGFGTLQLALLYYHNFKDAFINGFLIFSWWDGVKLAGAVAVAQRWQAVSQKHS